MSSTIPPDTAPTPAAGAARPDLATLRARLDRLDDALHDLLQQRAEVVKEVAATKGGVALRPGREAAIVRRLLARHTDGLPPQAVLRIWRELLAGTTAMQGPFVIAVCNAEPGAGFIGCAREHFGVLTPMHVFPSPAQAIGMVRAGRASAAVLPLPAGDEVAPLAWWTGLSPRDEPRIHVVARLPFWSARPEGATRAQALVVSAVAPDPSGADRSLLRLEMPPEVSRASLSAALAGVGFIPGTILLRREPGASSADVLADVDGFVIEDDPRLAALTQARSKPVVLGAYALPIEGEHR